MVRKLSVLATVLGVLVAALAVAFVATLKRNSVLSAQLDQYHAGSVVAVPANPLSTTQAMTSLATLPTLAPTAVTPDAASTPRTINPARRSSVAQAKHATPGVNRVTAVHNAGSPLAFNSAGWMMGTAKPTFASGRAGTIDVVYTAAIPKDEGAGIVDIPIAIRNNTSAPVSSIQVAATFRDSGGSIVATASNLGTQPSQLGPGEIGLADLTVETGGKQIPGDSTITFSTQSDVPGSSPLDAATAKVTEANQVGSNIVGSAENASGQTISGPLEADVWCFDSAGHLTAKMSGLTEGQASLPPGSSASFTVDLGLLKLSTSPPACDSYSVGVTGYFS